MIPIAVAIVDELAGIYLVVTLTATSLAKLRNWRMTALGVRWERIIPRRFAVIVVIGVSVIELSLATALTLHYRPLLVGIAIAALFLAFGCYRLMVAVTTGFATCTCAGKVRTAEASLPAVVGAAAACAAQCSISLLWARLGNVHPASSMRLLTLGAWVPACTAVICGMRRSLASRKRGSPEGVGETKQQVRQQSV
jgi:hypothetical protein